MNINIDTLVTLGFLAAMMWGMLKFMLRDITKEIVNIHADIGRINKRIDDINSRMDKTDQRMDNLYQICIDMLKAQQK